MNLIFKNSKNIKYSFYFTLLLFISSCSSTKMTQEYKGLNLMELEAKKKQLLKDLSYFKLKYYLKNVENGKSRHSLATIEDKNLKSILENALNDELFVKEWKDAVKMFADFEDKNSSEIREHRINYRIHFETKEERDAYYEKYWKLSNDLKREKFVEYTFYHDDFNKKLNLMWLNRGWYLLEYYKKNNLLLPVDWMKYQDYEGITSEFEYKDLHRRIKFLGKMIKRLQK